MSTREVAMTNKPASNKPPTRELQVVPDAPEPSAPTPRDGMETARAMARRYLPDCVRFHAGVAFNPSSEAPLHTKTLNIRSLEEIAGAIPQVVPGAPAPRDTDGDGSAPS
jgi:hypothetical protein